MDQPKPEGLPSGEEPVVVFCKLTEHLEMTREGDSPVWEVHKNLGNS